MIVMLAWYKCHEVLQTNYATFFSSSFIFFFPGRGGKSSVPKFSVLQDEPTLQPRLTGKHTRLWPTWAQRLLFIFFGFCFINMVNMKLQHKKYLWIVGTYNESLQNYSYHFRTFLYLSRAPVLIALQEVPKLSCFANICKRLDLASSSNRE